MRGKQKPDFRTLRRLENKTQKEVGEIVGISDTVVYNQENNLDGTSFGRVKELFRAIGYEVYVQKEEGGLEVD